MWAEQAIELLDAEHGQTFGDLATFKIPAVTGPENVLLNQVRARLSRIQGLVLETIERNESQVDAAVSQLARWMDDRAPVRVLGAGRARLAAAIPANRLAHGGARVYMQDSMVPMPHSLHGGGIIAASASGRTPSVLGALSQAKAKNKDIRILGVASRDASEFGDLCDIFIGLASDKSSSDHLLSALADLEEYAISELLDALVVAAGRRLGYTDATWRLGHEDLGPATGPYDFLLNT